MRIRFWKKVVVDPGRDFFEFIREDPRRNARMVEDITRRCPTCDQILPKNKLVDPVIFETLGLEDGLSKGVVEVEVLGNIYEPFASNSGLGLVYREGGIE